MIFSGKYSSTPILIDGHVHIHPAVDCNLLLDSAWENFSLARQYLYPQATAGSFVLLLAEGKENRVFSDLADSMGDIPSAHPKTWEIRRTREENSLLACCGGKTIILIAGRQVISRERLELLALFCSRNFPDTKHSLAELAIEVTAAGGTPLLAWGVGKWLGRRGAVIRDFLTNPPVAHFLVGDNGNRPAFWPYPALLVRAEQQGRTSLAGSDPLPLASHANRAGCFGSAIDNLMLDIEQPAAILQRYLQKGGPVLSFGKGVGFVRFIRDQLQVNIAKRLGKSGR